MKKRPIFLTALVWVLLVTPAFSQSDRRALSVADIEELLKAGVTPKRLAALIEERGIDFQVTGDLQERLKRGGADAGVIVAVVRAGREFAKKLEQERRLAEERRKAEEEGERRAEEERRRVEEAREEERRKAEEEAMRRGGMVLIPAGEFWMGSNDGRENEKPRRRVYLDAFYIDRYEVTNSQYEKFMKATRQEAPDHWNDSASNGFQQPVVGVSWYDAQAYCTWAGKRLPTEAEWEKAARGTDGRNYPWGNEEYDSSKLKYYWWGTITTWTASVGSYPSGVSPYGVHDMAGNVWEWVADWSGQKPVVRGGAWPANFQIDLRSSYRLAENPTYRHYYLGFRCAR